MEAAAEIPLTVVTYHAVTRYVQRVLGVLLAIDETEVGTIACAEQHCAAANMTIDEVRRLILNRDVIAALKGGITHVRCAGFRAVLHTDPFIVITVAPDKKRFNRAKRLSKKESHRLARQMGRRHQRRPVTSRVKP